MKKLRNLKKIMIFCLALLIVLLMIPNFLYADWPVITLVPTSASIGDSLTINGTAFGAVQGTGKVTFTGSGDITAGITWSDTQIVLDIPAGTTTGNVTVTTNAALTSNAATLTIEPDITSLNPTSASIGDSLTINGTAFGAQGAGSTVTFAGSGPTTTVTSWSDTQIVLNIPAGTITGNVTVTPDGGIASNPATLTIGPEITSLNPTSASIGDALTINGTGFEAAQGGGKVTFAGSGDITAGITWSDTQIVLDIPAGTTTGNVTVTTNAALTSNAATLTIEQAGVGTGVTETTVRESEPEPNAWERTDIGFYEKNDTGFVTMLYSRFFTRPPDQTGFNNWLARIRSGNVTGEDLMNGFIFGEECQTRISGYTNSEFIMFLYEVFFDREPSQDNYNIWLSRMNAGMTREIVVIGFTHSDEFISLCNQFGIVPYIGYEGE